METTPAVITVDRLAARAVAWTNPGGTPARAGSPANRTPQGLSRERHTPARQLLRQPRPGARQPPRDRADRPAELIGGLPMSLALQLAEDDGDAVLLGLAAQLLVKPFDQVVALILGQGRRFPHLRHLAFPRAPPRPQRSRLQGRLVRDPVEPVAELLAWRDRRRLASQNEERRLQRILGVVVIPQHAATDAPDHRTVAVDRHRKDGVLPASQETLQELPVRQPTKRAHLEEGLKTTACRIRPSRSPSITLPSCPRSASTCLIPGPARLHTTSAPTSGLNQRPLGQDVSETRVATIWRLLNWINRHDRHFEATLAAQARRRKAQPRR